MTPLSADLTRTAAAPESWVPVYGLPPGIASGQVSRARQVKFARPVALKVRPLDPAADPTLAARFEAEAVVLGKLHHPHIVQVYDFGRFDGRLYIAMELLEGEDLGQRIQRA